MGTPFALSIVGSWLFVKGTAEFHPRIIYHFTTDGRCHWEFDIPQERRQVLNAVGYKVGGDILTVFYKSGSTRQLKLTVEDDGSVGFLDEPRGVQWWATRLPYAEPYSRAFVSDEGKLIESLG